jgi:glycosyltransferase involved in cell wall biosynthesis
MPQLDISVIVPCFNSHDTLRRCLESVACQTSIPREIVIVDDGSERPIDGQVDALRTGIDIPIKLLHQPNRGAAAARNTALRAACGRFAAFLDADDIWLPDKLRLQHAAMETHGLLLSGHGYSFDGESLALRIASEPVSLSPIRRLRFAYGNPLFTPTVMVRREEFSGFDERFRRVDDYKAWLENFQTGRYALINTVLAAGFKPPIGHSGLTGSIDKMHQAFIEVLDTLLAERRISYPFYCLARTIEAAKLPVRRRASQPK